MLSVFWLLMVFYRRETYAEVREMWFFGALFSLVMLITAGTTQLLPIRPEMVPIPFAAILVTLLYNGRIGVFAALTLAVLLDGQWALRESGVLFFGLVGGVAGAIGIRAVRRRRHLYVTVAVVAGAATLASITVGLLQGWPTITIVASILLGALMALASAALAMLVMPLAESATRITTDLTLLELSDLGRPLLRRLALEAPGTWAHSLAMANLCESACNIIGANGLLARVGCYYHDVGKLGAPGFFVENQGGGPNPHDHLPPLESARIIRQHVLDGIALAEQAGLPPIVKAFIPEHHGTTEISYFLVRARRTAGNGVPNPADYRYPGPAPAAKRDRRGHAGRLGGSRGPRAGRAHAGQGARSHRAPGAAEGLLRPARRRAAHPARPGAGQARVRPGDVGHLPQAHRIPSCRRRDRVGIPDRRAHVTSR